MTDYTSAQLLAAAEALRAQEIELEAAKTILHEKSVELRTEAAEINARLNDVVLARHALEYKAGEQERMGTPGEPSAAVEAIIAAAISAAEVTPVSAEVGS